MSKRFQIITNLIIGILAFILILFTGISIYSIASDLAGYHADEDSLLYDLESGNYAGLLRSYHENTASEAETTKTMEECYAIARYYEAGIDYKLAIQENDTTLLKKAEKEMKESSSQMGELSYAKEEIDEILGL